MLSVSVSFCLSLSFFLLAIYMIWSSLYCMIDYFIDCFPYLPVFQEVLDQFGVDATRLCILSSVSPQSNRMWSNDGVGEFLIKDWTQGNCILKIFQSLAN